MTTRENPIFRVRRAVVVVVACAALAACGDRGESDPVAAARAAIAKKDDRSAIVHLKNALQQEPNLGEARFLLGSAQLRSGSPADALVELQKAEALSYDSNVLLPRLVEALIATGQPKKAVDGYAAVTLTNPKAAADLKTVLAGAYHLLGQMEQSAQAVDAALKLDPDNVAARLLSARMIAGRGQVDDALKAVDAVAAAAPKRPEVWQLRGELLWRGKSDPKAAATALRQALTVDPAYVPAHVTLTNLLLQEGDTPGFKTQLAALKKAAPNYVGTLFYETQALLIDKDFKRAREGVQHLLRMAPDHLQVLHLAGAVELQAGGLLAAEKHFGKILQTHPDLPSARRFLAEAYLRGGQPARVLGALQPLLNKGETDASVLALAAEAYLQEGDVANAEAMFTRAAKANPGSAKIGTALALAQLAKGDSSALAQLESLASRDPDTFPDLALISARLRTNELDAALKAVDRLEAKATGKPLPHLIRGRILFLRQDMAGARRSFESALKIDAAYTPAVAGLAKVDMAEKKPDEALRRFKILLEADPRNPVALLATAQIRHASGASSREVAGLLAEAVKLNPEDAAIRLALIDHHLASQDTASAVAFARDSVAALPGNFALLDALGRAQLRSGDAEQALRTFRALAGAQPNSPQPYLRLADAYVAKRDLAAAKQSLQRALETTPHLLAAQQGLSRLALNAKRFDEAVQIARTVQKQRPKDPIGHVMEGEVQSRQRHWGPAIEAFKAALDRSRTPGLAMRLHALYFAAGRPADAERFAAAWMQQDPADSEFLFHLGTMAMERKEYEAAQARFNEVLKLRPDNGASLNNIAWLMIQQGKPGAVEYAERASRQLPDQAAVFDTLASALAAEKQPSKAAEAQRKAVALAPKLPDYRLKLAKLLVASGDRAGARVELDKLAALGDKFSGQAEVSALLKGL